MIEMFGIGELFANYFMTIGIDEHMKWMRSILKINYIGYN